MATFNTPDKLDYFSVERLKNPLKTQDIQKKSILVTRGREPTLQTLSKRESSKTTIQWKGIQVNKPSDDQDMVQRLNSLPSLRMLLTKGSRWNMLQGIVDKINIQEGNYAIEEEVHNLADRGAISLVRTLGSAAIRKLQEKDVKLTFDQEVNIEIMKQKIKAENQSYLKQHPEVAILLSLIYRTIFKHKPKNPKAFIANYVHYLNSHRDKLVLEELDVPFDRPLPKVAKSEVECEREIMLEQFARSLLNECVNSATLGSAYFNVINIIKSMLRRVSPSSIISDISDQSVDDVANDIMTSLLTEVVLARSNSSELVVHDVLSEVLANVHPSILESTELYPQLKQSVERFIKRLLKSITEKAIREAKHLKILHKSEVKVQDSDSDEDVIDRKPKKPILKIESKVVTPIESKVTFKTFPDGK